MILPGGLLLFSLLLGVGALTEPRPATEIRRRPRGRAVDHLWRQGTVYQSKSSAGGLERTMVHATDRVAGEQWFQPL